MHPTAVSFNYFRRKSKISAYEKAIEILFNGLLLSPSAIISQDKPNIILIMADDLGIGDVGYTGFNQSIETSHLDAISKSGIRFDRFYSQSPVCSPTRGSCMTGRHPFRYGIFEANVGHLRPHEITLPQILKDAGYATAHFGKWHLGALLPPELDNSSGMQDANPLNTERTHTLRFIKN